MGNGLDCIYNFFVAGTPAEVPRDCCPYFFPRRVRVIIEEIFGNHEHAWGAKTALNSSVLYKGFLDGMKPLAIWS